MLRIIAHFVKYGILSGTAFVLILAAGAWVAGGLLVAVILVPEGGLPDALMLWLFVPSGAAIGLAALCSAIAHLSYDLGDWKPRTGPFIERLKRRGDVASLTRALRYREEAIRIPAAEALGELGTHAALWPLVRSIGGEGPNRGLQRALTHRDAAVRGRVLQMLQALEIERYFGLIVRLLNHPGLGAEARSLVERQQPAMRN